MCSYLDTFGITDYGIELGGGEVWGGEGEYSMLILRARVRVGERYVERIRR